MPRSRVHRVAGRVSSWIAIPASRSLPFALKRRIIYSSSERTCIRENIAYAGAALCVNFSIWRQAVGLIGNSGDR
jgi:hypothetical protein